jgi:hypothetical protein
MPDFLDTV